MLLKTRESIPDLTIEMTPLIDMVFLLLIFFLVATTFQQTEREMQIALPFASSSEPISSMLQELIINVDAEGKIILGGRTMEVDELRRIVEEAVKVNPDQKATVRGDRRCVYASIMAVLDVCKAAGIQEPYLDTVPAEGP